MLVGGGPERRWLTCEQVGNDEEKRRDMFENTCNRETKVNKRRFYTSTQGSQSKEKTIFIASIAFIVVKVGDSLNLSLTAAFKSHI